jgi:murein DD-endopeptidase MepM/ murein hydrolase activator NlpD
VQVVCAIPPETGVTPGSHASFFFAHLSSSAWSDTAVHAVQRGEVVGAVGKSGNASGASVAPHLHLEAIVQDSEAKALAERHSGRDNGDTDAARELSRLLTERCLTPAELSREDVWRNRRVDPFVLLTCLGSGRPAYRRPGGALTEYSFPWSARYHARFDVDAGSDAFPVRTAAR